MSAPAPPTVTQLQLPHPSASPVGSTCPPPSSSVDRDMVLSSSTALSATVQARPLEFGKRPVPSRKPSSNTSYPSPSNFPSHNDPIASSTPAPSVASPFGPTRSADGPSSTLNLDCPSLSPWTPPASPPKPVSLLSQILTTHSHKLSLISGPPSAGPISAGPSPSSSVPTSTASSPVGSTTLLPGIYRRRGSHSVGDALRPALDRVGEEGPLISHPLEDEADQALSLESSDSAKPAVASLAGREAASPESAVGRLDGGSFPSLTPTLEPPSPSRRVVPKSALEPPKTSSRLSSVSGPPSPTRTSVSALVLPVKKVSNLTFAVTTVCARPEAMGAAPGLDRKLHEPESDEDGSLTSDRDDEEQDEEEDENQDDADSAGYLEDSEGETTDSDGSDEEGDENDLEASPAERRRYRYKRHSMFGESDSDEDNPDSDALAEDGDGSWKPGQRDSVLSDLSLGAGPEPTEPTRKPSLSRSASMLRHRRSLSLKSRGPKKITFGPAPALPTSTATAPLTNGGSPPSRAVSTTSRRTHFPTPLILLQDHSAFPRSPVPPSTVRGGGYSPRVRKGSRIAAGLGALSSGGERSAKAALGRDDFLPTHLKSEEGKNREREYDSTTDHGAASGRCSRHRSPPPNSAGKDKMREHSRRSRSALLSGEDRAGSSRGGSTDPGLASSSSRTRPPEPPNPAPILLRSSTATGIGPSSGVSRTVRGELTPVFFSETEDAPSGCPSPAAPPSPNAHSYHPHFQLPSQPASPRALPLATPPPSRRVSSSVSERRASLSVVCSAFRRPSDESVGPASQEHSTRPTLALDGTSPSASARGVSPGDGSLAQSLHQALAVSVSPRLPPPVLPPSTAIRPFSPPPSAPSSFGRHKSSLASPDLPPSRSSRHGPGRRRLSQPSDALAADAVQSRPIACPRRERSGGWTDGC